MAAVIVLRKDATVKILDMVVPVMAVCYFAITILIIVMNLGSLPGVFARIFEEAFGFRQAAAGGFGAVLMNGIKRGLFSNEAGSGSAPCAAAAAECDQPVKAGLVQALGDNRQFNGFVFARKNGDVFFRNQRARNFNFNAVHAA